MVDFRNPRHLHLLEHSRAELMSHNLHSATATLIAVGHVLCRFSTRPAALWADSLLVELHLCCTKEQISHAVQKMQIRSPEMPTSIVVPRYRSSSVTSKSMLISGPFCSCGLDRPNPPPPPKNLPNRVPVNRIHMNRNDLWRPRPTEKRCRTDCALRLLLPAVPIPPRQTDRKSSAFPHQPAPRTL